MNPNTPYVTHLAIAKFSHTTTLIEHAGPLTWHHVNGNGELFCIFEKLPGSLSMPARLIMRVIQPQGTLEHIDLVHAMTTAQDLNGASQKTFFTVIVKMPCLAIKYPSGPTYLRRFQIKFGSDRDYYTALALLGEINCPLTEGIAPSVPSSRRLPSTMSLNSEYAPSLATSHVGEPHTSPAISFHRSAAYGPATATTTNPPLSCAGSASHVTSYQARTPARSIGPSNDRAQATFRRPQDTLGFDYEPMRRTNTYTLPSTTVPYHDIEQLSQMLPPRSGPVRRTSTTTTATRPAISAAHHDIESLSHDLPPKRTLPFPNQNPTGKKPRTNAAPQTQTPSSTPRPPSAQLPYPYPEPNERQESHENAPLQGLSRCAPNIQVFQSQPPSPTPTQRHPQRLPTQRLHLHPPKPPSISQSNTSLQRSTDLDGHILSATQPYPDILPAITSITQPESQNQNQNPGQLPPPQHPFSSSSSIEQTLSQYSSAPTAERTAVLENWMCELLEDDKFMALCEDVEGVWRRFAFGKKT